MSQEDSIIIYFLYVNEDNEMYSIKQIKQQLNNKILSKEKQLFLITNNQYNLFRKHKLIHTSYFEINSEDYKLEGENTFFNPLKIINDIKFDCVNNIFKPLTSVYYIYKIIGQSNNTTRRIILNNSKNKTHKNQIKKN
tara:strand:- start:5877 stop:6290 length:414 start_codon:yes stop_codon:yes gene_type:complete